MALINCPECNKEISDKVKTCPNCGYPFVVEDTIKQVKSIGLSELVQKKKKLITIIAGMILLIIVSGTIYYQQTIKPKQMYGSAIELLEKGKYEDANKILSQITDYKDVKTIQKQIKYESIAYICITDLKNHLKNPDSLQVYDIEFYQEEVREYNKNLVKPNPNCVIKYSAENGFGGNTTGYALFASEDHTLFGTCDTLDKYEIDEDEYMDLMTCIAINTIMESLTKVGEVDLNRIKMVIKNETYSTIKIIE